MDRGKMEVKEGVGLDMVWCGGRRGERGPGGKGSENEGSGKGQKRGQKDEASRVE